LFHVEHSRLVLSQRELELFHVEHGWWCERG
jgi:hypothetical protein